MSAALPANVVSLLEQGKYIHLATANPATNEPHVLLMNYIHHYDSCQLRHLLILLLPQNTVKVANIRANPQVLLLLHDYSAVGGLQDLDLMLLLRNLNQRQLVELSVTLAGSARLLEGEELAEYQRELLTRCPEARSFVEADAVMMLIEVTGAKVTDSNNNTSTY